MYMQKKIIKKETKLTENKLNTQMKNGCKMYTEKLSFSIVKIFLFFLFQLLNSEFNCEIFV